MVDFGGWNILIRGEAEQAEEQVGSSSQRQVRVDQRENQQAPQRGAAATAATPMSSARVFVT